MLILQFCFVLFFNGNGTFSTAESVPFLSFAAPLANSRCMLYVHCKKYLDELCFNISDTVDISNLIMYLLHAQNDIKLMLKEGNMHRISRTVPLDLSYSRNWA